MSAAKITLQNYRAFPLDHPITFELGEGITFVLGVNNVGKSALIRGLIELRDCVTQYIKDSKLKYHANLKNSFEVTAHRRTTSKPIRMKIEANGNEWIFDIAPRGEPHNNAVDVVVSPRGDSAGTGLPDNLKRLFTETLYIPSFRSPTVNTQDTVFGMHIGHSFVHQWDEWANGPRIDFSGQVGRLIDELQSLFGFQKFAISVSKDNQQLLVTTEDGRFSLTELGDGISHYIIVLGNAMITKPAWILIDEPEIGLHPRMQEIFVRALASKAKDGVIATSHSVGLARSVADQVLTMTRGDDGARTLKPFGDHFEATLSQSISEMGYSQYAELGANHLLLVEGRTDIKAFREILRKFQLEQHFLIWSLNGSEWVKAPVEKISDELNELKRLNAKSISVIFDSERTDAQMDMSQGVRPFNDLCRDLGFNVLPTDRHSTENYITQEALNRICPGCNALGEFEVFGRNGQKWDKSKNWLLFREMSKVDIESTGLGKFITETLRHLVQN